GDALKRFEAAGWNAVRIDGHNPDEIAGAIEKARHATKPTLIACRTVIGYGSPNKHGKSSSHGSPLGADEIKLSRQTLGWEAEPFVIPAPVLAAWREVGARGGKARSDWEASFAKVDQAQRAEFERQLRGDLPAG